MKRVLLHIAVLWFSGLTWALNVKDFGAMGDGYHIDSPAINAAIISATSEEGEGIVVFPEGIYLCYSIRLQSNVTLRFEEGAVLKAALPNNNEGYDEAESNESHYQDFGHSHWHNSLIWGEHLHDVILEGKGLIDGTGVLLREGSSRGKREIQQANKALAMRECESVTVCGLSFLNCGHFAMLMTGVDNLLIDGVVVDSNRDGIDIDCCEHVIIRNSYVNTLNDDAIVLKCSWALGYAKPTSDVQIYDCHVSGFDPGSMIEGTFTTKQGIAPDGDGPTGRIKLGTESSGGFKDITISRCTFSRSRGLALETVDGAIMENIQVSDLTMRNICNSPIYICLGSRMRVPEGFHSSSVRGICINNVHADNVDARYACLITGLEGNNVRDVRIENLHVSYHGGFTLDDVTQQRGANPFFFNKIRSESPPGVTNYPEPAAHGIQPAWGLCFYHASDIKLSDLHLETLETDERPWISCSDTSSINLQNIVIKNGGKMFIVNNTIVNEDYFQEFIPNR